MTKKKIFIITPILLILSIFSLIYISENKNIAEIPSSIISLDFEFTNVFLIPSENGYILVDNAYEKEIPLFNKQLKEHNIDLGDIKYVLLTHHHDDHVGFVNYLKTQNPEIIMIMSEETSELIRTGNNNKRNGGGIVNKRIFTLFKIKQKLTPDWKLSFTPYYIDNKDIIIKEDYFDLSELLNVNIKLLATPGHTSDSVSFIYNDEYAFCGDLASNFLNWAGSANLTLFNEDIDEVYKSWKKLMDNNVKTIITAHGKPFYIINLEKNMDRYKQEELVKFF